MSGWKRYWLAIVSIAIILAGLIYSYQARPFSVAEWTSDWDGGPDRDSPEFRASIVAGERLASDRQREAPYHAVLAFFFVLSAGVVGRVVKARFSSSE